MSICVGQAKTGIIDHIHDHGDGPFPSPPDLLEYRFQNVHFELIRHAAVQPDPVLSYNDSLIVLDGMASLMSQNDYRYTYANVYLNEPDQLVGLAELGPEEFAEDTSS